MGIYDLNNPGRAGSSVAKYDGWMLANIINDFAEDLPLDDKLALRRAFLVSYEARTLTQRGRINV